MSEKIENILVTGGSGFIGSNLIEYLLNKYEHYQVINLDKLTYAGKRINNASYELNERYTFIQGDICDEDIVNYIMQRYDIKKIFHLAAESHVDNSIESPEAFVLTNVLGTMRLLDGAKKRWMKTPHVYKTKYENARFLHVSTDEVYGTLGETGLFTEKTPYAPNSPYSASKASSDMLVRSYYHTFGLNVVTTNCSNNYGPRQHEEKLIPVIIQRAINNQPIPIYGDGSNIRDWLYVKDHCKGIDLAFHNGKIGETYNIGGRNEKNNNTIVQVICDILDEKYPKSDGHSYADQIKYVKDRPGHDQRYAIDATKIENELEWKADENFETGILKSVDWYMEKWLATSSTT